MSENTQKTDRLYSTSKETKTNWTAMNVLMSLLAHIAIFLIYSGTLFFAVTAPLFRKLLHLKKVQRPPGRIQVLITGTFYNEGWIRGHLVPLAMAQTVEKIYLVSDRTWFPLEKVCYITPPTWLRRLCGRSLSRIIMVFATTIRQKPDLLMGYHIMPNSLVCLIAASIIGASSAYQMTGGPIQVIGGGTGSENSLLRLLVRKSKLLERLLFQTLTYFDLVVVRGQSALAFAKQHGLGKKQIIITAGIDTNVFRPGETPPELDAICVSRLIAGKGLEFLIKVIGHCHQNGYQLKAAIVGDGPIKLILSELLINCGLNKHVTLLGQRNDINNLLKTARIFMLTSETEGMSIALLEAIATGLPAAITPVGDLGDAVTDGLNGIFLDGKNPHVAASSLMDLLRNDATMNRMSEHARYVAEEQYSSQALAQRWDNYLTGSNID